MRQIKKEKIEETLHRLAAEYVVRNSSTGSLITITRVEISPTGRETKIFFTTLPDKQEDTVEKFLTRKIPDFKEYIKEHSRLNLIPHIDFKIDYGERNRQRLEEISN